MANNRYSIGLIIVALGIVLLLGKLGIIGFFWGLLWPVFILAPGVILHMLFFGRMLPSAVLIPGGILVTISILFLFCNVFGWSSMQYLWPVFPFSVAVGLYEYYLFDKHRPREAFTAALILAIISAFFFGLTLLFTVGIYLIAVVLIIGGVVLLRRSRKLW
ncbi:hypothetical protein [Paenibacillus koleovorans]|uniref:hypothetical protein n=1 Tax=Paenibacillus koleovorans TaxID=121608 RepID=UPI000FD8B3FD|nr:hypothetical protein [Paenibacillus koleovorans]